MPAAYAHHRFGDACIEAMPENLQEICKHYRELFDFGVHGPDLLFYYKPLSSNKVNRHGSELHHWTGAQFFEICRYVYQGMPVVAASEEENGEKQLESGLAKKQLELSSAERHALLAYVLGFLAHFTLDSSCHAYINQMAEESPLSHNLIESQYEAFLMEKDEKDPLLVDRSLPLKPSGRNARVVANLFPFEPEEILESMKGQHATLHLFYSPKEIKKKVVRMLIKLLKVKGDFGDLFLDQEELELCVPMNEHIFQCQKKAEERYPVLLKNLMDYLNGKAPLNTYFEHDFEGEFHGSK